MVGWWLFFGPGLCLFVYRDLLHATLHPLSWPSALCHGCGSQWFPAVCWPRQRQWRQRLPSVFHDSPPHVSSCLRWEALAVSRCSLWLYPPLFAWGSMLSPALQDPAHAGSPRSSGVLYGPAVPTGSGQIAAHTPELVPWVWGINGCASVVSGILATLLAMHWGFTIVTLLAVGLYGMAAILWGRIDRHALRPHKMCTHSHDSL